MPDPYYAINDAYCLQQELLVLSDFLPWITVQLSKKLSELMAKGDYDDWSNMLAVPTTSHTVDFNLPSPHIRLKMRYKHDVILPVNDYKDFQTVSMINGSC